MKLAGTMFGALAMIVGTTGCVATHKYVAKTIAPVEQRVTGTEGKNVEQDKQLTTQGGQIEGLDRDLSGTKERLTDTTAKANAAGEAAKAADAKAGAAQQSADGAKQAADGARTFAEQGLNQVGKDMQAMNHFQNAKTESILFGLNQDKLTDEGKAQLDDIAKQATGMDRYVIEVQGFTDKTGSLAYNEELSARRAEAVTRYLTNNFEIPVRNISMLGSGYARPVGDDKTRDGRKQNRRVEVRLFVPESQGTKTTASSGN